MGNYRNVSTKIKNKKRMATISIPIQCCTKGTNLGCLNLKKIGYQYQERKILPNLPTDLITETHEVHGRRPRC